MLFDFDFAIEGKPEKCHRRHDSDVFCSFFPSIGKSQETENCGNCDTFLDIVPETPPRCRHKPVCDEAATVRGNMPLLWRRLFPWLSSSLPVPAVIRRVHSGKWTVRESADCYFSKITATYFDENRATFPCEIQQYSQALCTTHNSIQKKSAKRPFPAVFVVTDSVSNYSPAKKPRNVVLLVFEHFIYILK